MKRATFFFIYGFLSERPAGMLSISSFNDTHIKILLKEVCTSSITRFSFNLENRTGTNSFAWVAKPDLSPLANGPTAFTAFYETTMLESDINFFNIAQRPFQSPLPIFGTFASVANSISLSRFSSHFLSDKTASCHVESN